jgi:hypothetical protein
MSSLEYFSAEEALKLAKKTIQFNKTEDCNEVLEYIFSRIKSASQEGITNVIINIDDEQMLKYRNCFIRVCEKLRELGYITKELRHSRWGKIVDELYISWGKPFEENKLKHTSGFRCLG